jgi:hypothetical protein
MSSAWAKSRFNPQSPFSAWQSFSSEVWWILDPAASAWKTCRVNYAAFHAGTSSTSTAPSKVWRRKNRSDGDKSFALLHACELKRWHGLVLLLSFSSISTWNCDILAGIPVCTSETSRWPPLGNGVEFTNQCIRTCMHDTLHKQCVWTRWLISIEKQTNMLAHTCHNLVSDIRQDHLMADREEHRYNLAFLHALKKKNHNPFWDA